MRTYSRLAALSSAVVLVGSLVACVDQPRYAAQSASDSVYTTHPASTSGQQGVEYGVVSGIEEIHASNRASGVGAVLGAVVGGVLGHQVGGGSGRTAATVIGAVGGGVAGNAIEGRNSSSGQLEGYRLIIRLDQGGQRVYQVTSPGDLRAGDRVRLNGGQISRI